MERSPLIEKEESEIQKSAPEEVPESNEELTQKVSEGNEVESCEDSQVLAEERAIETSTIPKSLIENFSEGKEVESCEDSQVLVKEMAIESVPNFKKALVGVWLLVTPYLLSFRLFKPLTEDFVDFVEYIAGNLDSFCSKYETIQDIKLLDIIQLVRSGASAVSEFLQSNEFKQRVLKYFALAHKISLESLDYAADLLEVVVPTVPDLKPLLELDAEECSIRKKSFYIMVNFFYRFNEKTIAYVEDSYSQLQKCLSSEIKCKAAVEENVAVE